MARRINVNIFDDIPDEVAVALVARVVSEGRVSDAGKQYCYVTCSPEALVVCAGITRAGNDTFHVYQERGV